MDVRSSCLARVGYIWLKRDLKYSSCPTDLGLVGKPTVPAILVGRSLGRSFCLSHPSRSSGLCCGGWEGHASYCLLGVVLQGMGIVHLVSWER